MFLKCFGAFFNALVANTVNPTTCEQAEANTLVAQVEIWTNRI